MSKVLSVFYLALFLFTGCTKQPEAIRHTVKCEQKFYALKRAECLNEQQLMRLLEPYPVLFIGDHHDNDQLHQMVAQLITDLHARGYKIALANEWFVPEDQALLERYSRTQISDDAFKKAVGWKERSGYVFDSFAPIYHAVQEANGTLYGINLTKAERKKISDQNSSTMQSKTRDLYTNLDLNVSAHQQMLSPFFSHCHKRRAGESEAQCVARMYRVQVAWDTAMGENSALVAKKILHDKKVKLIVFVGAYHLAYGLGANLRFARKSNLPFLTLLSAPAQTQNGEVGEADLVYFYSEDKNETTRPSM